MAAGVLSICAALATLGLERALPIDAGNVHQVFLPVVHGQQPTPIVVVNPWPMEGHDVAHTGRSPFSGPSVARLEWQTPDPNPKLWTYVWTSSSPVVAEDSTIYVATMGYVAAINPNGSLKWMSSALNGVTGAPTLGPDRTIYANAGSIQGIVALNPDGTLKWRYPDGGTTSIVLGGDGTIYAQSSDGYFNALNSDGTLRWRYPVSGATSAAIASDGTIYFGASDGCVYALGADGSPRWKYPTGSSIQAAPAVSSDGSIYVGSNDTHLYALNPDGSLKWRYKTGSNVDSTPAIGPDGTIYVGSQDTYVYALRPDASLKWKFQDGGDMFLANPIIGANETIYLGATNSDTVYALNADGTVAW